MISKPLTTVTINNDPLVVNALGHGTRQVVAGLKQLRAERGDFMSRSEMAGKLKSIPKSKRRSVVKAFRPGKVSKSVLD